MVTARNRIGWLRTDFDRSVKPIDQQSQPGFELLRMQIRILRGAFVDHHVYGCAGLFGGDSGFEFGEFDDLAAQKVEP
jgi:hypothetical protein